MAKKLDMAKIYSELNKAEDPEEMYNAFDAIKIFVTQHLSQKQQETEDAANELQSKIQKLNGK